MTELKRFFVAQDKTRGTLLVIHNRPVSPEASLHQSISFDNLNTRVIRDLAPETVVSVAISARFDCMDVAALLAEAGFSGRYRVIAQNIPNPRIIRDELTRQFPGLDIELADDRAGQLAIAV